MPHHRSLHRWIYAAGVLLLPVVLLALPRGSAAVGVVAFLAWYFFAHD